jgi:hypothetical protein
LRTLSLGFATTALGFTLAGCTSGNSAVQPPFTSIDVATDSTLQFAVGTANINRTAGLNTVVTFRNKKSGLSATLLNSPAIAGPASFVNDAPAGTCSSSGAAGPGGPGTDAGTNLISSTPQTLPGITPVCTTFGQSGGAFGYGFAPANSTTAGAANYPQYSLGAGANNALNLAYPDLYGGGAFSFTYPLPFYFTAANRLPYLGGPPAYPFFLDGFEATGFLGYPAGFTDFAIAPVLGSYVLTVALPAAASAQAATLTATATLTSTTLLPAYPTPSFTAAPGGSGVITVAPPAGVTESLVYVVAVSDNATTYTRTNTFFTVRITGSGTQTATIPGNLGRVHAPSFNTGDRVFIYAVGFNYPAFDAAPPGNVSANPAIVGANGQADITTSTYTMTTY